MSKHPKRPRDTNQLAKLMVDILTGQVEDREPMPANEGAAARGRLGGQARKKATRLRSLILAAADSTINQTIALRSNMLAMAQDNRDAAVEQFIEERRQKALVMIEKMKAEPAAWPNGRDGHGEHD